MKTETAIRKIMEFRGIRFMELADRVCISTNTLAGRIKSKNISVNKLNELLKAMEYKIVIVPESREMKQNEFVIR